MISAIVTKLQAITRSTTNSNAASISGLVGAAAGYLLLVQSFRYRRHQRMVKLFQSGCCDEDKNKQQQQQQQQPQQQSLILDPEVARQIVCQIGAFEFPLIYRISLEFALFRTYAIPSISKLLHETKQFQTQCGKRYDDTALLIEEMNNNPFTSKRSIEALQRINAIHNMYHQQISNNDMLYVLSVFVLEPKKWIDRFEWRPLSAEEYQALFSSWKSVGKRMGIQDIPDTLSAFEAWREAYEQQYMTYADSNIVIGNATIDLFLSLAPKFLHPFGHQVAYCLMDSRLRAAMGFPNSETNNPRLQRMVESSLALRQWCLRYLCLPRFLSAQRIPFFGGSISSTTTNGTTTAKLCPRFHVYERTYPEGYETAKLGTAPAGKLMTGGTCPNYSD
jgi:hypothetical protein